MVLGGHGDQMVPVVSATTVGGVPLTELVSKARIAKMVQRTRVGGGEIVNLLGTSAWYAPGAAAAQMVDAILLDEKRILPCTALLEGEYGIDGLYMGVPVKLGAAGIEEIVKLRLSAEEKKAVKASAARRPRGRLGPNAQVTGAQRAPATLRSRGSRAQRTDGDRLRRVRGHRARHRRSAMAEEGANVAMFARRRDVLEREADRLGALAVRGDVTVPGDLERLVERTIEAFGGIDVVVHNSGGPPRTPALEMTRRTSRPPFSCCSSRQSGSPRSAFPTSSDPAMAGSSPSRRAP